MALTGPGQRPEILGILALVVAFLSASLDIVLDAYRTDVLLRPERGFGAALWVNGYRCALLLASAGALLLADHIGWQNTYLLLAALMAAGIITIFVSPEPSRAKCHAGKSGRSDWWTAERILCASRGGRAPRPHCPL